MNTQTAQTKEQALAKFLDEDSDSIRESSYDDSLFEVGSRKYLVLTDEHAKNETDDALSTLKAYEESL